MDKISAGYCYTTSIIRTATIDICAPKSNGWMDLEENVYEDASIKVRDEIGGDGNRGGLAYLIHTASIHENLQSRPKKCVLMLRNPASGHGASSRNLGQTFWPSLNMYGMWISRKTNGNMAAASLSSPRAVLHAESLPELLIVVL